ncbi:MAG: prepilin-type N-terminal cleavage/methylation domain-containing protein [Desulfatiglandaceae bacterium]
MKSAKAMKLQAGFTLIEIIAVLLLLGILGVMAAFGVATGVKGYLAAAENAAMSQKAQLAMNRLSREILGCFDCDENNSSFDVGTKTSYTFENTLGQRLVEYDSGSKTVKIDDNVLVDKVDSLSDFDMTLEQVVDKPRLIIITLRLSHEASGSTQEFKTSILPRNR